MFKLLEIMSYVYMNSDPVRDMKYIFKGRSTLLSYRDYLWLEILPEVGLSVTISTDKYACFDIIAVRSVPLLFASISDINFYTNGTGIKFSRSYRP